MLRVYEWDATILLYAHGAIGSFEAIAKRFLSLKRLRLCRKCRGLLYEGYVSTHIKYFA